MFGGNFAPAGWMLCQGQLLPIAENETLFQLIGTTYGGDGQSTFALPNLSSRVPIHMGTGGGSTYVIGEAAGTENVTVTTPQLPLHTHSFLVSTQAAASTDPTGQTLAKTATGQELYTLVQGPITNMSPTALSQAGGNQPHENIQPYLAVNYIISLFGIFPSPS